MIRRMLIVVSAGTLLLGTAMAAVWVAASVRPRAFSVLYTRWALTAHPGVIEFENDPELREKHSEWVRQLRQAQADLESVQDAIDLAKPSERESLEEAVDEYAMTSQVPPPSAKPRGFAMPIVLPIASGIIAGLLAASEGVRQVRRWARRRKGCCEACGYALRANADNCPACGTAVPAETGAIACIRMIPAPIRAFLLRATSVALWVALFATAALWVDSHAKSRSIATKGPRGYYE
ncbi:MAG TPA: hypothetical protein VGI81_01015, partial [Tepidisphaeraceae bacterium]